MSVYLPGPQGKMPLWQFTGKLSLFHMVKRRSTIPRFNFDFKCSAPGPRDFN